MFSLNFFRNRTRPYANRLPTKLARRAMLSVRVHEAARRSFRELALHEGMSVSEYVNRVLSEHLLSATRRRSQERAGQLSGVR